MASRILLKRISASCFQKSSPSISNSRGVAEFLWQFQTAVYGRENHTKTESVDTFEQNLLNSEPCNSDASSASKPTEVLNPPVDRDSLDVKYSALSSLKTSSRHDLAMVFTCRICETRSVKTTCRESYEKGIVVARCSGCNNFHLMADHLGWFGEPGSIEDLLAARGEEVKKGSVDTLCLTLEDLAGSGS